MTDFQALFGSTPDGIDQPDSVSVRDRGLDRRQPGVGLALSGGGFRAMLFHVGALRRLHEVGALAHVERISSVSGGSIAAARLALAWDAITAPGATMATFEEKVQEPLFDFAGSKLDARRGIEGVLRPRSSIADQVAKAYDDFFDGARLQQLPDEPRFVFCATNMGSGSLLRFAKPYTADYRIGKRDRLDLPLGQVVAASAAFPPVLSPMTIDLEQHQRLTEQFNRRPGESDPPLAGQEPYVSKLQLSDGGVYDNLGLQPVDKFHTLLVSDGGGPFGFEDSVAGNWLGHMVRAWKVTDNQVRSLRRDGLVTEFRAKTRAGAYWGIGTAYHEFERPDLTVDPGWADAMEAIKTRLWTMPKEDRKRLINWAYCLTDAALRSYVDPTIGPAPKLPYPDEPLDRPPTAPKRPWWRRLPGL